MLLVLNLPHDRAVRADPEGPYAILSPLIVMFVLLGAYALNNSVTDVLATILFGIAGLPHEAVQHRAGAAGAGLRPGAHAREQSEQGLDHGERGCDSLLLRSADRGHVVRRWPPWCCSTRWRAGWRWAAKGRLA
ncbi:MAG: tripartite tricarboxylate transporter permease [Comamonadaceae bacterium]|nr:tripartite tricarboxylate transporter permease [Comamonadaceae bacterium]